jgi:hypothetical protein
MTHTHTYTYYTSNSTYVYVYVYVHVLYNDSQPYQLDCRMIIDIADHCNMN